MTTVRLGLEAPAWLWLLAPCVPAVWIVALAWPIDRGRARWMAAATRTVLVAGLILAAARPVRFSEAAAVSAVALFDVSASVSRDELKRERHVARQLLDAGHAPHDLRLVRFAVAPDPIAMPVRASHGAPRHATVVDFPSLDPPPGEAARGTDIARALGLAAGLGDPTLTRRILLVSDGRPTSGDAQAQAARLADLGIRVDTITLGAGNATGDVAIDSLSAPGDVQPHATFPLQINIAADRPTSARVTVTRDGASIDKPRDVTVSAGETTITWNTRVDTPSTAIFSAHVEIPGGTDAHPENDRGILAIAVEAPPRVLILTGQPGDATPLVEALRAQSIETDVHPRGRRFDATDAAALARADLIVLADLPRAAMTDAAIGQLDAYVRDGGGLLVTGGPNAFGPGGWSGSRLENLLPLRLDLPERQDEPALALALVIDRSGSMSGPKMELTRKAARATAEMLPPDDLITVVAFDSQATTVVPLQRASNRMRIAADIGRIQPTGGTNILAGLREATEHLGTARAKKKHAILLSDGQSATDGIGELVDAAAASRITISTVGVGDGVDDGLLQMIARQGGGRYYHTRDPASIPRIFTRETSEVAQSGIIERPTAVVPRKRAAMLEGVPLDHTPRLGGYVRTHARAQADLLLATDGGDPLLARWALGLGQVVAWTSDLGPRWSEAWARWPPFAKFWGQIARGTMRARATKRFPLTARLDGAAADVSVEAVGDNDQFLSGLEATLEITEIESKANANATRPARRMALLETAPGRYEAHIPIASDTAARPGALLLRARLDRDRRPVALAGGHLSIPAVPELRPVAAVRTVRGDASAGAGGGATDARVPESVASAPVGPDLLATIAARTGGRELKDPVDLFRGAPPRRTSQPLRTPLLVALLLLFVVDVAIRRLPGNRPRPRSGRPTTG